MKNLIKCTLQYLNYQILYFLQRFILGIWFYGKPDDSLGYDAKHYDADTEPVGSSSGEVVAEEAGTGRADGHAGTED